MIINTDTKLIARFHTESNGTGLNIYNPYFQDQGINAVYLLFTSKDAEPLVAGMRNLNIIGAITAGFEHDPFLPTLVDEQSKAVELCQRVGILTNRNGVIRAHYQAGEGLQSAIEEKFDISDKRIVIVGAGSVVKTFLLALEETQQKPREVIIINRSIHNGVEVKDRFNLVAKVLGLEQLEKSEGDILINATRIGSQTPNIFTASTVSRFNAVADVTFGTESTVLIQHAKNANKVIISGWDMFTHQASVVLKEILGHQTNIITLRQFVRAGLGTNNHGRVIKTS